MSPKPILFDVTKLLSRSATTYVTGIDRVERAWLDLLVNSDLPVHYLLERKGQVIVFAPSAGAVLKNWTHERDLNGLPRVPRVAMRLQTPVPGANGKVHPARYVMGRVVGRIYSPRRVLRETLRPHALNHPISVTDMGAISQTMRRIFPKGGWYVNVGQRIPTDGLLPAFEAAGLRSSFMIHDTIPLDWPQFCTDDDPAIIETLIRYLAGSCDLALCNSHVTADNFLAHARRITGAAPRAVPVVAHLGLHKVAPREVGSAVLPDAIDMKRPIFTILGTIEPRKNHAFLLDVWERMAAMVPPERMPQLVIAGAWGWKIADFRARLAKSPLNGHSVFVMERPDDATVALLLRKTQALLMASFAEGYGLPVLEAAREGIPVIAAPLDVYREIAGDYPVYASLETPDAWIQEILGFTGSPTRLQPPKIPSWSEHFAKVVSAMNPA